VRNYLVDGENYGTIPEVAAAYRDAGVQWIIVGDENYGEGSAREHAAMQPRFLGCVAVVCRSFARIHETNLKRQGVFPLTFADPNDYDQLCSSDIVDLIGLRPGEAPALRVRRSEQEEFTVPLRHTLSPIQMDWIRSGSALNYIAQTIAAA